MYQMNNNYSQSPSGRMCQKRHDLEYVWDHQIKPYWYIKNEEILHLSIFGHKQGFYDPVRDLNIV